MTISLTTETNHQVRSDYDYVQKQRYDTSNPQWGVTFGTSKTGPYACTSKAQLFFDPSNPSQQPPTNFGFWPRFEFGNWTFNALLNYEMQQYADTDGIVNPQAPSWAAPLHELTTDSLKLHARLDPSIDTDQKLVDLYLPTLDPSLFININSGQNYTIRVGTGKNVRVGSQCTVVPDYNGSGANNAGRALITDYVGDTVHLTGLTPINGGTGGVQGDLIIMQDGILAAMINTRGYLPTLPLYQGMWEVRCKMPYGSGHWPALWHNNRIGVPEMDPLEFFRTNNTEKFTRHADHITGGASGQSMQQVSQGFDQHLLNRAGSNNNLIISDMSSDWVKIQWEWGSNWYSMTQDGVVGNTKYFKWVNQKNATGIVRGDESVTPNFIANYAFGLAAAGYRPNLVSLMNQCVEIDYIYVYPRIIA